MLQQAGQLALRHQLLLVGFPGVVGEQPPFVGAQGLARARFSQHLLDGATTGQSKLQQVQDLRRVGLTRQPRDLETLRAEQDQGWIAAHIEALAQSLRTGDVAIEVNGDKVARLRNEVLPVE